MIYDVDAKVADSVKTADSLINQAIDILDKLPSDHAQVAAAYLSIALDSIR